MIIKIAKTELQKNINLAPDWYEAIFMKMDTKKNEKNPSVTNFYGSFELVCDHRVMDNVYIAKSDQLRGMQPLASALTGQKPEVVDGVVKDDIDFEPEAYYGKKLKVRIDNDPFEGRLINKIKDFLPIDADTSVPFGVGASA